MLEKEMQRSTETITTNIFDYVNYLRRRGVNFEKRDDKNSGYTRRGY